MRIGSGQIKYLLAKNKQTKSYKTFLAQLLGIEKIIYNAYASPIDALRIGQITEDRYYLQLCDEWLPQIKVICKDLNILVSTLDFAILENNKVQRFREVKSINFNEFIALDENTDIKKKYKDYYNQVQAQLLCSDLNEAELVFICVENYDDELAMQRVIKENEIKVYKVSKDEEVQSLIVENAKPFQVLKDYLKEE